MGLSILDRKFGTSNKTTTRKFLHNAITLELNGDTQTTKCIVCVLTFFHTTVGCQGFGSIDPPVVRELFGSDDWLIGILHCVPNEGINRWKVVLMGNRN